MVVKKIKKITMPRITLKEIEQVYFIAKNVYFNNLSRNNALNEAEKFGINRGSAHDLISNFKYMIDGVKYTRTNNNDTTEYYLENIYKDFGLEKLKNATRALYLHIEYYENLRKTTMHGLRNILNKYESLILNLKFPEFIYPDEVEEDLFEGAKKQITVNGYERNAQARQECVNYFGYRCSICSFDFENIYGEIGKDFIHVHHVKPLSEIDGQYKINPIEDLRPVCPNCHSMLHKRKPSYSIEELKNKIILKK